MYENFSTFENNVIKINYTFIGKPIWEDREDFQLREVL